MKNLKKVFGILSALLLLGGGVLNFVSCSDDGGDEEKTSYSISIADTDKSVTLKPGDSKTISVETNGTMLKPDAVEGLTVEISNTDKTIKITANSDITEKTEKSVKVELGEDSEKSVTITVTVDPEAEATYDTMNLTLNFAEEIGASKVSVTYWDSSENNPSEDIVGTVESDVANNTATVKLSSQYKGDWGFKFSLVVKNASGEEVAVTVINPWFEYEKDGTATFSVEKYVASSKNMTINFVNLGTVAAGTVKYGSSDTDTSALTSADMVIAEDGASATVSISSDYCNDTSWFYIAEIKVYSDADKTSEITGFEKTYSAANDWQDFASIATVTLTIEDTSVTYSFPYTTETLTVDTANTYTKILPASAFSGKTVKQLIVTVSSETENAWASLSAASTWTEGLYWENCINAEKTITDETFINGVLANGLYMQTSAGDFVVTVNYSEEELVENEVTYSYSENALATKSDYTGTGSFIEIASSAALSAETTVDALKIEVTGVTAADGVTDSWWFTPGYGSTWLNDNKLAYSEGNVYTTVITDASVIAALKENGLYLAALSGLSCTVNVYAGVAQ